MKLENIETKSFLDVDVYGDKTSNASIAVGKA